jgi:hypothetical protein
MFLLEDSVAYEITGSQALAAARENPMRQWTGGAPGSSAQERLSTGHFFPVRHRAKFGLRQDTRIFTMGSCFAREVENVLIGNGVPLVTAGFGIRPEMYESWDESKGTGGGVKAGQTSRGALNKYTVASMTHEIRRVLCGETHDNDGLIEIQPGIWFDPHAAGTKAGPFEEVLECRRHLAAATAQIRQACQRKVRMSPVSAK